MSGDASSLRPILFKALFAFLGPLLALPLSTALAWSGLAAGEMLLNLIAFPAILVLVLCLPGFMGGLALLFWPRFRRRGLTVAAVCAAFVLGTVGGILLMRPIERQGWLRVIARAEHLVAAIHAHERRHGTAPERLEELVPAELAALPTTGLGSSPEFHYRKADSTNRVFGDRWAIRVRPPQVMLGFDTLFYVPSETYPERGFGGGIERIGRWAYVHE
jgi:hypothetical protein